MLRYKIVFVLSLLFLSFSSAFADAPFVKGELLIQQSLKAPQANVDTALKANGCEVLEDLSSIRVKRIRVPEKNFDKVKAALAKNPNFTFVEENFIGQGMVIPNDPSFPSQWHHTKIMSPSAWEMGVGSTAIPIAIIDSGVDPTHPDLAAKLQPGHNFLGNNNDTHDVLGHGTAVAGSAGAIANNAKGVAGIAWNNPIVPLVVLDASDYATYANISSAIIYAVNNGIKVINISIGGSGYSSTLNNAVDYAWNNGALVFASAANYNNSTPYYPAACTHAIAVAATDSADNKASFSNYGSWITLAAPGAYILTTNNGGGYGYWNGTSFSSPLTAGLAALIWSINPQFSNQKVLDILETTADDLGASGFDNIFGHGRINAYNAMMEAMNYQPVVDSEAPTVALTTPFNNESVSGNIAISVTAQDNVAVERVDFSVNGVMIASDTAAPFATTWNASNAAGGVYTIEARAFDSSGNVSQTDAVQVIIEDIPVVTDNLPPMVTILSPSNGITLANKTDVKASAADENSVAELRFFVDGSLMFTQSADSATWHWNTRKVKRGSHSLKVEARDPAGNIGTDEIVVYK